MPKTIDQYQQLLDDMEQHIEFTLTSLERESRYLTPCNKHECVVKDILIEQLLKYINDFSGKESNAEEK